MDETTDNYVDDIPTGFASAASLVKRVDELERQRELVARQWKLNLAFYKGKQYVFYNLLSIFLSFLVKPLIFNIFCIRLLKFFLLSDI